MECPIFVNEKSMVLECDEISARKSALNFVECLSSLSSIKHDIKLLHFGNIASLHIYEHSMASLNQLMAT